MDPDAIYGLLPAVHRRRDADAGEPLRALLRIVTEQAALIEADIERTYDNWFIETCEDWVAPYIGELVGHEPAGVEGASVRREVGRLIAWRRRKGNARLLEELADGVAGWPARAVEYRERLDQTQSLRFARAERGRSIDLRARATLAQLGAWKDRAARLPDLRSARGRHEEGAPGPGEVGLQVWRLRSFPVTDQPAACREEAGPHCFTFSPLAADMPLFLRTDELYDRPLRLTRHTLALPRRRGSRQARAAAHFAEADADGRVAGFTIRAPGWGDAGGTGGLIPAERIIPADLEDWRYQPPRGHVAVDPELGRIAFPPRQIPRRQVRVSYCTGFSAGLGGGEYARPMRRAPEASVEVVRGLEQLQQALRPWQGVAAADGTLAADPGQPADHVIEIDDSGIYTLPLALYLGEGHSLQIRAGQARRPVLRLLDWQVSQADNFFVHGESGSRLVLDGLLVFGRGIQLEGDLASFTLRHATLVPGWALGPHCDPRRPSEPSIEAIDCGACITIDHSITGSIQVNADEVTTDPVRVRIRDSIVDATGIDCDHPQCEAIGAAGSRLAFARLEVVRATIIGRVMTHQVDLGEDSLFLGAMTVARRQRGCLRFCYVAPHSRTPRRYRCQPDLAEAEPGPARNIAVPVEDRDAPATRAPLLGEGDDASRRPVRPDPASGTVRPMFDSLRYGTPAYARLHRRCDPAIVRGASDRGEMGAFHHLRNPWRLDALARRLAEFTPADVDAGILFAD